MKKSDRLTVRPLAGNDEKCEIRYRTEIGEKKNRI